MEKIMTGTSNNLIEMKDSEFTVAMKDETEVKVKAAFSARTNSTVYFGDGRGGIVASFDLKHVEGYSAHNQGIAI